VTQRKANRRRSGTALAADQTALVPLQRIAQSIFLIRGQRVMLDTDLAAFYGVQVKRLNEQVKRNLVRFPPDFMFQLSAEEAEALRSQIATLDVIRSGSRVAPAGGSYRGRHRKYCPYAFTEHGAIMAASVLNSERVVQMSVLVVRAFVRLRQILATHKDLARRIEALERQFTRKTRQHEAHIRRIYELLDEFTNPSPPPAKGHVGFAGLMRNGKQHGETP
jgi:hypothetical protein